MVRGSSESGSDALVTQGDQNTPKVEGQAPIEGTEGAQTPTEAERLKKAADQLGIGYEEGATNLKPPDPDARGPWVQYNGIGTLRIMDKNAWTSGGVSSDKYAEWNSLNKKRIPVSTFTAQEMNYLLSPAEGRFSVVDDDGNPVEYDPSMAASS